MAIAALQQFAGHWFVVKVGGEVAKDVKALSLSVGTAIRQLTEAGIKVAVIHGAGPQATALSEKLGLEPKIVGGRRITDESTLEVLKMTLAGQVSIDLARAFRLAGVDALATTGVSARLITAVRRPPRVVAGGGPEPIDMGYVGDVQDVRTELFEKFCGLGLVPLVGSLCGDDRGNVFNINADTVATRLAAQLKATKLFLVSNAAGVLLNPADPSSRIPRLSPELAKDLIARGAIFGGMIPKVEESLAMLQEGIEGIHVVGLDPANAIIAESLEPGSVGTHLMRNALAVNK